MSVPKLCAIDIDGTLVTPEKTISKKNSDVINRYVQGGGTVLLASGRMHSSIRPFAVALGLPDSNLILSYNGAMAKTVGGELQFERPVPADLASEIVEYCHANKLHLNFYVDDVLYVEELNDWSRLYYERSGSQATAIGRLSSLAGRAPTKLIIIDQKETIDALLVFFRGRYDGLLNVMTTDDEYLEFMAVGVDKGTGLAWAADRLGFAQNETIAFGDSYNDVGMIAWAGIGVAMSNGRDAAKAAANIVADNSDWSGVGTTLGDFLV